MLPIVQHCATSSVYVQPRRGHGAKKDVTLYLRHARENPGRNAKLCVRVRRNVPDKAPALALAFALKPRKEGEGRGGLTSDDFTWTCCALHAWS